MLRLICRAKLHRLTVTEANIAYEGSLTIDDKLLKAADIIPGEQVQVVNLNNGERFETYVIEGKSDSGVVCLNGGTARLGAPGDKLIVMSYALVDDKEIKNFSPKVILVDERNRIKG